MCSQGRIITGRFGPPLQPALRPMLLPMLQPALLMALFVIACPGRSGGPGDELLVDIPRPDLANAQESVSQQIEAAEAEIKQLRQAGATATARAAAYGDLGLIYVTYSFLDAAEASFENARLLAPADYRWSYLLGYLFQIQGRLDESQTELGKVLALRPDDLPALIRLGTVALELGRTDEARRLFARVVDLGATSAAGFNGLGRAAAASGDHGAAVVHFEKALELQPQANSIRHALGLSYRALGDRKKALLNLEKGSDARVLFADPLLQPVAELGRSAELFLVRGAQAFSEHRYDQAATAYRRALEIDAADFTTHKALGFSLEKLGDIDAAIAQLELALVVATTGDDAKDRIEQAELYRIMGGLQVLRSRDEEAIAAFERALQLDPERLAVHMKLANALARNRRFQDALAHYDSVLDALPDHADAHLKRATVLVNLGRADRALADFEHAVAAAPEDATLRLRFAEALQFLGRTQRAAAERAAAVALAPGGTGRAAVLLTEANGLVRRGELETAVAKLEEALAADAGYTDARFELARLRGHFGRYEEALEEFARVIQEAPWHRPARHGEVTVLLLLEHYDQARDRLQDGLAAIPRDRALAHALARLLAIAPGRGVTNGSGALDLARRVHTAAQTTDTTVTLALAHAAAGEFEQAVIIQRRLLADPQNATGADRLPLLQARLDAFERLRRWEARSPDEVIEALVAPLPSPARPG